MRQRRRQEHELTGIVAERLAFEAHQASAREGGADKQKRGERDFSGHQRAAHPDRGSSAAAGRLQVRHHVNACCPDRGRSAEYDSGDDSHHDGKHEHPTNGCMRPPSSRLATVGVDRRSFELQNAIARASACANWMASRRLSVRSWRAIRCPGPRRAQRAPRARAGARPRVQASGLRGSCTRQGAPGPPSRSGKDFQRWLDLPRDALPLQVHHPRVPPVFMFG